MAHDRVVTPTYLLQAQYKLQRSGLTAALADLEQREPDLAEYVLETLTHLHHKLAALGGPGKLTRQSYQQIEGLVLVALEAQRLALLQFLDAQVPAAPRAQHPPLEGPPPA